ncbi:MAG: hypothetical protein IPK98_12990 [Chloracidobacterium sp.]|nr:hypothetical protein [Chloracidobacterium sp.]
MTPYTSYLATDGSMANISRDAPAAADMLVAGQARAKEKSGAGAVTMSTQQNAMKVNWVCMMKTKKMRGSRLF